MRSSNRVGRGSYAPLRCVASVLALLTSLGAHGLAAQAPEHVYLTWRGNTSTTMTVNAQTVRRVPDVEVRFDTQPRRGAPGEYRNVVRGEAHQIEGLADGRWVHWIDLTDLVPGQRYWFVVGSEEYGFSAERSFRTLPDDDSPIRFVAGGDLGLGPVVRELQAHAAARRPQFAIIGGDLAYANGVLEAVSDWDEWLDQWEEEMVTPEGLTVPMVLAPGNHEVQGGYLGGPERAPFYMGFFAQPGQRSFFHMRFGELMALYTLDSGHIVSQASQVEWLTEVMAEDSDVQYRFAQYHIPMYPSHRDYDAESMAMAREHWLPVFDRYGLTAAFENHDHTFKRTHPLRRDQLADEGGTVYFGDGAWGRGDRPVRLSSRWYLAAQGANRHFWVVDIRPDGAEYRAVDARGVVFHVYPSALPDAAEAEAYFRTLPQQWELREGALDASVKGTTIDVVLTNREDYSFIATLGAVDLNEDPVGRVVGGATAELEPGESMMRTIELDSARPSGPIQIRADLDVNAPRGRVYARVAATVGLDAEATAPRVGREAGSVALDGSVDEWTAWPWEIVEPAPREDGLPAEWDGIADASARIDFRVDGEDLIVAVSVTDDRLVPHPGNEWDEGDGIVLWIDEAPDGEYDDDPYMGIALPSEPGEVEVIVTDRDWEILVAGSQAWARTTEDGWSAELRIPLGLVGDPDDPTAIPEAVRLNVGIVDLDRAGQQADVILRTPEWELDWDFPAAGVIRVR